MRQLTTGVAILAFALMFLSAHAAERNLADGLAAAGEATALKGNTAQAKDLFYRALAHDENCPDALFELAKIVDKDGDATTASELYQHAALIFAQENKPGTGPKRAEAEKRVRALNPVAAKLDAAFEEYGQDLDKIVKKLPDPLTEVSAEERVNELQLPTILPPDKLPKFFAAAQAGQTASGTTDKKQPPAPTDNGNDPNKRKGRFGNFERPKAEGATSPDVEKELKALGWTTVTGTWVKKEAGVYEATDAKLEAIKSNGVIDFWVVKSSGDGTIKATVRTEPKNENPGPPGGGGFPGFGGLGENEMLGYGIFYKSKEYKDYGYSDKNGGRMARRGGGNGGSITALATHPLNEAAPKHHFSVKVEDTTVDMFYNNSGVDRSSNAKLTKSGSFVIDVNGTVTIEAPRCTGQ